jgi:hypothetical protein
MPDDPKVTALTDPATSSVEPPKEGDPPKDPPKGNLPAIPPKEGDPPKDPPKEPVVPEKYDLKLPDGSVLQVTDIETTASLAKEFKLSQEDAQKLLNQRSNERAEFLKGQQDFLKSEVVAWGKALTADKEIAGEKGTEYKPNVALAKQAINRFASPDLIQILNETGYGNHPELVRMMVRIGKAMREDKFHPGDGKTGGTENDIANKFYPPKG